MCWSFNNLFSLAFCPVHPTFKRYQVDQGYQYHPTQLGVPHQGDEFCFLADQSHSNIPIMGTAALRDNVLLAMMDLGMKIVLPFLNPL